MDPWVKGVQIKIFVQMKSYALHQEAYSFLGNVSDGHVSQLFVLLGSVQICMYKCIMLYLLNDLELSTIILSIGNFNKIIYIVFTY